MAGGINTASKLVNAVLYFNGGTLLGQGQITLPQVAFEDIEMKPLGGGSFTVPARRLQPMEMSVSLSAPPAEFLKTALNPTQAFTLSARGVFQTFDALTGAAGRVAEKVEVRLMSGTWNPGTRAPMDGGEFEHTFKCLSFTYYVDGAEIMHADIPGNIYRIDGTDLFEGDRVALGL